MIEHIQQMPLLLDELLYIVEDVEASSLQWQLKILLLSSILHHHYNGIEYVLNAPRFQAKEENWLLSDVVIIFISIEDSKGFINFNMSAMPGYITQMRLVESAEFHRSACLLVIII